MSCPQRVVPLEYWNQVSPTACGRRYHHYIRVIPIADTTDRPSWIDPALGMVPLAVALLAWAGALCVYTVA